jgi:uncharacterized protein (TIGR02246 family)
MAPLDAAARVAAGSFYEAVNQVMQGNAAPMLALWSDRDDVTYLDPRGIVHHGRQALATYWERGAEANRSAPGAISARPEHVQVHVSGALLCAITIEHIQIMRDGRPTRHQARATNVYRNEEGRWRMIHRHSEPTVEVELPAT